MTLASQHSNVNAAAMTLLLKHILFDIVNATGHHGFGFGFGKRIICHEEKGPRCMKNGVNRELAAAAAVAEWKREAENYLEEKRTPIAGSGSLFSEFVSREGTTTTADGALGRKKYFFHSVRNPESHSFLQRKTEKKKKTLNDDDDEKVRGLEEREKSESKQLCRCEESSGNARVVVVVCH